MKPYIILHMLTSLDSKITGDYMQTEQAQNLCQEYYRINREYKADAFICGRITMEQSFTNGVIPNLNDYKGIKVERKDYIAEKSKYYAVSIDPHGRLGWYGSKIIDEDEGYNNAHVIEVLTEQVQDEYLAFLQEKGISYIFCGTDKICVETLNEKLYSLFGIKQALLEGGGLTDTLFLQANSIDELSLVVAPFISGTGKDLFTNASCNFSSYYLNKVENLTNNGLWLNYKKK